MNSLKKLSHTDNEMVVGNYMVLFGGRDLAGEYFTRKTQFESPYTATGVLHEDFEHGMDVDGIGNNDDQVLGVANWRSAKVDDNGIYVERILNRRAEYMEYLAQLIDLGVMGSSSAAIPGKTARTSKGEITVWPLMRDSLTVTPMEPRMITSNVLTAAKALAEIFPHSKSLALLSKRAEGGQRNIEALASLSDIEDLLRDNGGMSRTEAKALIAHVKNLGQRNADEGGLQQIAEALSRRGAVLIPGPRDADEGLQTLAAALQRRGQLLAA